VLYNVLIKIKEVNIMKKTILQLLSDIKSLGNKNVEDYKLPENV